MIVNFSDETTQDIFNGIESKKALKLGRELWAGTRRRLDMINAACDLKDLRVPPGNRLQKLKSKKELYSIRINDQYRIVFNWADGNARNVEVMDYH